MSQQVPFDNSGVPLGNEMVSPGYANVSPGNVTPVSSPGNGGGYLPPPRGPQTYARNRVPMIDPIESAKLTPQILILLVFSGLRRHWKWSLPMGLILGLLAASILYLAFPLQHEAKAIVQIRSTKPRFLFDPVEQGRYDDFVNTQLALMKSSVVIDKVLEQADVAKLPIVQKQKDKRAWLVKKLRTKLEGKSEIVGISIETDSEDASEKIVNAVVDTYFAIIEAAALGTDNELLVNLQAEKRRYIGLVNQYQSNIREKTKRASIQGSMAGEMGVIGGFGQGESLKRDVLLADAKLTTMRAELRAIQERIDRPDEIPLAILLQYSPEISQHAAQREALQAARDARASTLVNPADDARIKQLDKQISDLDAKVGQIAGPIDQSRMRAIQDSFRAREELNKYELLRQIRVQEILVEDLTKKHNEQLTTNMERSTDAVDVSFDQEQLRRANKTLEQIDDRILAVQSEMRAPGRIQKLSDAVSSRPSLIKQFSTVGTGAAMFAFFPLFLSIAIERLKPRLYHVSQVRRAIPQVLIGEIMEPPVSWIHGATFRRRLARYRESVHNWCTHLLLSDPFRSCRTLSVASVAGDDGKTFLAVQIAVAMAQMKNVLEEGPVLLIDGDMRVGRLHLLFGNEETGVGLADVLDHREGFGNAVVQNEKEPGLHLLSAGQLEKTPYELLGDGRFRELLDMLEQSYSLIIVVLPPVANASESLMMASSTDSTLLCVRQGETVLAAMEDVYRKLVNTGAAVDGIVVKDIPYYQMAGKDGGFADKLEQIRLSHLLQYTN